MGSHAILIQLYDRPRDEAADRVGVAEGVQDGNPVAKLVARVEASRPERRGVGNRARQCHRPRARLERADHRADDRGRVVVKKRLD